jgi:uncharacterized membrane protein YbaN (DUF454 family)
MQKEPNKIIKGFFFICGTFFVGLGIIGIVLPILPTVPFLLLATFCYARSSKRLHSWLLENRWLGKYIKDYQQGKRMEIKAKIFAISFLWISMLFTAFVVFNNNIIIQIILISIATGVTLHLLSLKNPMK